MTSQQPFRVVAEAVFGIPNAINALEYDYSIVIPVYYNEGSLAKTLAGIKSEVIGRNSALKFEVVFVDDGSGDGSLGELLRLLESNPHLIKVIKLTRNFGQVAAMTAGCSNSVGRALVMMSADGQDPPELINEMIHAHRTESVDVVVCTREGREESLFRIWTSKIFYRLMRKLSFPNMPEGGFDYVLLSRRVVDAMLRNREAHPFFQGQILWTGFPTKFITYRRRQREVGVSRWTFRKKLTYLIDGILAYSFAPIRFTSIVGGLLALIGLLYAFVILVAKLVWGNPVPGAALVPILILLIGGFQLIMLGVIGEYLWRTLAQARNRDPYIIEAIFESGPR